MLAWDVNVENFHLQRHKYVPRLLLDMGILRPCSPASKYFLAFSCDAKDLDQMLTFGNATSAYKSAYCPHVGMLEC